MKQIQLNSYRRWTIITAIIVLASICRAQAQTVYVNATSGKDGAGGTITDPLASLEEAVKITNGFEGSPITIKVAPGLYVLSNALKIKKRDNSRDSTTSYTIEAQTLPDDSSWTPAQMPVIQSISGINDTIAFKHCIGILVERNNVNIKGIKFVGNANTASSAYYPIRRVDKNLNGLNVSQCFFIGEKNSAPIQSALWVSGPGVHISHCIFQSSKIAMVLGKNLENFSLTYSIINDAYNTAIWYGFSGNIKSFIFKNNIVTNSNYVMVYPIENGQPEFTLSNSFIGNNGHFVGNYPKDQNSFMEEKSVHFKLTGIKASGMIKQVTVYDNGITRDNLNLTADSDGLFTKAGIFNQ